MNLKRLGFDEYFKTHFREYEERSSIPARIVNEQREQYTVLCEEGSFPAKVPGKIMYMSDQKSDFPAVGDWVAISIVDGLAKIEGVLPRKSKFSRNVASANKKKSGGKTEEQIVASNINTIFIVSSLDHNYNRQRIERFLTVAFESGATPVVVLNKADLVENPGEKVAEIEKAMPNVSVFAVSAATGDVEPLKNYVKDGETVAFLGQSGVGKSSLINTLAERDVQKVSKISDAVNKGRHTTTSRQIILLEDGGLLLDTPGMREIQVWSDATDLAKNFNDIIELSEMCRFADCKHVTEPGCAVKEAIDSGDLDQSRFNNYLKLKEEIENHEERQLYRKERNEKTKKISKQIKSTKKSKKR